MNIAPRRALLAFVMVSAVPHAPAALAQSLQTYDLLQFSAPEGSREDLPALAQFTQVSGRSFCRFGVYRSLKSVGDAAADFRAEWTSLGQARGGGGPVPPPHSDGVVNGWTRSGAAAEEQTAATGRFRVRQVTFSGHGRRTSALALYNDDTMCQRRVDTFMASLTPITPPSPPAPLPAPASTRANASPPAPGTGFAFTSTTFDDGWVAAEQPDWVRVSKANAVVLIHHTRPDIRSFNNVDEATTFVWNALVAPRYSNVARLWVRRSWYADGGAFGARHFAEGDLTEKATGRRVHVALYRGGNGARWLEFITPDKEAFQKQFTVVHEQDGTNWEALSAMANHNKFAVAASDLPGNWHSSSGAGVEYYNAYSGNSMGMASASSTTTFTFNADGTYTSVYSGVDGMGGNNRYAGATFRGAVTVGNWEIRLTNRFKGATETFAVQFEAVKGGRILHMDRGSIEELHLFRTR
jgi:hypothetical protein